MDIITFQPYQELRGIDILINGRNLIDIMREIEQPLADQEGHPDLAGEYARFWPSQFFDLTTHFLSNHQATLLVCGACGLIDCVRFVFSVGSTSLVKSFRTRFQTRAKTF